MSEQCKKTNRVTFKKTHENRNIKALLKEFHSKIAGKDHKTSQKIELALVSISKYPVQITSGEECFILKGFDKNLCNYVDEHLFKKKSKMALGSSDNLFSNNKMSETIEKNNLKDIADADKMDTSLDLNSEEFIEEVESIDMPPGSYEIVMLVDKNEPEMLSTQFKNYKYESRNLKVGDVIWVARSKTNSQELVLPHILERKRMDDFASSIKDGRFHEQKFRLRKCGLRNVIYLLEDHKGNKHCGLSLATLNQAVINTRVQDGFVVHRTDSLSGTKRFLNMMTLRLACELEGVHLRGTNAESSGKELMTFDYFNASSSKTRSLTVKELFIKMLLQLKGLSVEKALAITKVYNSPKALMDAYKDCDTKEGEMLLANLRYNSLTPRVAPAISKVIYMLFNKM